jgi:hypothetical protein
MGLKSSVSSVDMPSLSVPCRSLRHHISSCKGLGTQGSTKTSSPSISKSIAFIGISWGRMQSRLQHGDENKEKGASLPRSIPSMAAVYTIIGIGKRHTGQACVLSPLPRHSKKAYQSQILSPSTVVRQLLDWLSRSIEWSAPSVCRSKTSPPGKRSRDVGWPKALCLMSVSRSWDVVETGFGKNELLLAI